MHTEQLIWIGVSVGVCALLSYFHRRQMAILAESVAFLAKNRGGTANDGVPDSGAKGSAWMSTFDGATSRLYFHTTSGKHAVQSTRFEILGRPGQFPRVEVYPQNALHAIAKLLGMQDIEIGDAEFDREFILKAESETLLKAFLSPEVRRVIRRVKNDVPGAMYLRAASDTFELRVDSWLSIESVLTFHDAAIAAAKALLDQHQRPPAPVAAPPKPGVKSCPICGKSFEHGRIVSCRTCGTPHHEACWEHNGTCAVYGCTGILFSRE